MSRTMEYKNLMGLILSGRNMMQAYGRVLRNGGAAGVEMFVANSRQLLLETVVGGVILRARVIE